jgi:choline dehydrogenase
VHESPQVGEHLQDHFYARTFWRCRRKITLNDDMATWWRQALMGMNYLFRRKGHMMVAGGYAAAFVRTRPELKRPDAQIYFINFSSAQRGGVLRLGFTCAVSQTQSSRAARCTSARPTRPRRPRSATTISRPRTIGA